MRGLVAVLVAALTAVACGADEPGVAGRGTTAAPRPPDTTGAPSSTGPIAPGPTTTVPRAPVDPRAPVAALATGFNEAGFALLRTQPAEGNVVLSPASVGHALLMARAAADTPTGAAIDSAFALAASAHEAWNALDQQIAAAQGADLTVTIADRLWPALGATPDQQWLDLLAAHHGAGAEPLDLAGAPDASRDRINGWVSEQTQGLIPELLPPGFIDPSTVLVLTDTLYFKARWEKVFGKYGPVDGTFTRLDGTTVPVEFMQELELGDRRGSGDGFVGAEIPYVDPQFAMLVIVPDEGRFAEIRDRLDHALLDEIDASFTTGPYELLLPRWHDTTQIDLLAWLTELGAAPGHYPAIAPNAYLDAAVHATDIEVDEWGTVAAAATGLGFAGSGPPSPELVVAADQPFLYLIRHRPSGLVLFAGQVTAPTA